MATRFETAGTALCRRSMTRDEWWDWYDECQRGEWVDGELVLFETPKIVHQETLLFLTMLLHAFADRTGLGEVLMGPLEMWLPAIPSARTPDILFVANDHRDRITEERLEGPADLVVEIVNDDSVVRDRVDKLAEYQTVGVPEFWLVDPRRDQRRTAFNQLGSDGRFREVPLDANGRYHSAVLSGFWFKPSWLWQEPRHRTEALAREILGRW